MISGENELKIDGFKSKKFKKGRTRMVKSRPVFHNRYSSSRGNQIGLDSFALSLSELEKLDANNKQKIVD